MKRTHTSHEGKHEIWLMILLPDCIMKRAQISSMCLYDYYFYKPLASESTCYVNIRVNCLDLARERSVQIARRLFRLGPIDIKYHLEALSDPNKPSFVLETIMSPETKNSHKTKRNNNVPYSQQCVYGWRRWLF